MFCTSCGAKFDDKNFFCPECGTKVERIIQQIEAEPVVASAIETEPVQATQVQTETVKAEPVQWNPAPAPAPEPVSVPIAPVMPVYSQPISVTPIDASAANNDPELAKSAMTMGILAVVFAGTFLFSFMGIVFGAIGLSKAKKFTEECGQLFGKAKAGKYLSLGGLIGGSVITAYYGLTILTSVLSALSQYN